MTNVFISLQAWCSCQNNKKQAYIKLILYPAGGILEGIYLLLHTRFQWEPCEALNPKSYIKYLIEIALRTVVALSLLKQWGLENVICSRSRARKGPTRIPTHPLELQSSSPLTIPHCFPCANCLTREGSSSSSPCGEHWGFPAWERLRSLYL